MRIAEVELIMKLYLHVKCNFMYFVFCSFTQYGLWLGYQFWKIHVACSRVSFVALLLYSLPIGDCCVQPLQRSWFPWHYTSSASSSSANDNATFFILEGLEVSASLVWL